MTPATPSGTVIDSPVARVRPSVTVMSLVPDASPTSPAGADSVTVVGSSSARTIVASPPVVAAGMLLAESPDTVTVSSSSSTASSVGVSVKLPVPCMVFLGMVMSKSATGAKSTTSLLPEPATETVTVVSTE